MPDINDVFNLENLVKENKCFKSKRRALIDIILTNTPRSFQKIPNFVAGISNCQKLILTILKSSFKKLQPKIFTCRSNKSYDEKYFFSDLDIKLVQGNLYKHSQDKYSKLTTIFKEVWTTIHL